MKFKMFILVSIIVVSVFAAAYRSNVSRVWIINGGTVQKSAKWATSDLWWKGLGITLNDTSRVNSDSCGVNIVLWGFTRNQGVAGEVKDSSRVYFDAVSRFFKTAWDTTKNAQNAMSTTLIDSSIVVTDSMSSANLDGRMGMVQISPICCFDSIQAWIYPNSRTKKTTSVKVEIRMNQIDPKSWR
jgi:hypothetical protein